MSRTTYSLLFALVWSSLPLHASLLGTSVSGSLVFSGNPANYFDPANGFVPSSGYLNSTGGTSVTVQNSAIEFGAVFPSNTDSADFSASQLVISDLTKLTGTDSPFVMTFTDAAFTGLTLAKTSDSFIGGVSSSLAGDVITVSWRGAGVTPGENLTAIFDLSGGSAAIPEPSSWTMLVVSGLVGLLLLNCGKAGSSAVRL